MPKAKTKSLDKSQTLMDKYMHPYRDETARFNHLAKRLENINPKPVEIKHEYTDGDESLDSVLARLEAAEVAAAEAAEAEHQQQTQQEQQEAQHPPDPIHHPSPEHSDTEEPPAKMPRQGDNADPAPVGDQGVYGEPMDQSEADARASGNSAWMAKGSEGGDNGWTDANMQRSSHGQRVLTKRFEITFEHTIGNNPGMSIFAAANSKVGAHVTPFHKIPYYMMRSSMSPESLRWLQANAYCARLTDVGFDIKGCKVIETVITGSDNNPRLRLKDIPMSKLQMMCYNRGYSAECGATRPFNNTYIGTEYINNAHMTNPKPQLQYDQIETQISAENGKLPYFDFNVNSTPEMVEWKKFIARDLFQARNTAAINDLQANYIDYAQTGDLNHAELTMWDPESELLTMKSAEEATSIGKNVKTHHSAWLMVNKLGEPSGYNTVIGCKLRNFTGSPQTTDRTSKDILPAKYLDTQYLERKGANPPTPEDPDRWVYPGAGQENKQRLAGLASERHRFPTAALWNKPWHSVVYNPESMSTEGPMAGWPEFLIRLNPESDLQGTVERAALIVVKYYCEVEYVPLDLPNYINREMTLFPYVPGNTGLRNPYNHYISPVMGRNLPMWPIGSTSVCRTTNFVIGQIQEESIIVNTDPYAEDQDTDQPNSDWPNKYGASSGYPITRAPPRYSDQPNLKLGPIAVTKGTSSKDYIDGIKSSKALTPKEKMQLIQNEKLKM